MVQCIDICIGISAKIRNAYSFLSHNYNFPGVSGEESRSDRGNLISEVPVGGVEDQIDEIVLVGFSRGAFTVQCLASLIAEIGLLHKDSLQHLRHLFTVWANQEVRTLVSGKKPLKDWMKEYLPNLDSAQELRRQKVVSIKACAVWDTVSSLGLPTPQISPRPLAFVGKTVPSLIKNAFQALALNESRRHFKPTVWENSITGCANVKQCWFLGSHSDVGGGNKDSGLAAVSFIWMVSQLKKLGITFENLTPADFLMIDYLNLTHDINAVLGTVKSSWKLDTGISAQGRFILFKKVN